MTEAEFVEKIDWEGGVWDALLWGLRADMLDDPDSRLGRAWSKLEKFYAKHGPELEAAIEDVDVEVN
jgi:hypothetical protein